MGWRDEIKLHPACELFDPLPQEELIALGEDIKAHRLQNRVRVLGLKPDPNGPNQYFVLDGRNRLDAIEAVGLNADLIALCDWVLAAARHGADRVRAP